MSRTARVEFEVDSNRTRHRWTYILLHDGTVKASGTRTTRAASGSFIVERRLPNAPGVHTFSAAAKNARTGPAEPRPTRAPGHHRDPGLCDRNRAVVHYALASATAPMAVSTYTYDQLPAQEQQALPSDTDLSPVIEHPVVRGPQMSLTEALAELRDHPSEGTP